MLPKCVLDMHLGSLRHGLSRHAGFSDANLRAIFSMMLSAARQLGEDGREQGTHTAGVPRLMRLCAGPPRAPGDDAAAGGASREALLSQGSADALFSQETVAALCALMKALRSLRVLMLWGLSAEQQAAVAAAAAEAGLRRQPVAEAACLRLVCESQCAPLPLRLACCLSTLLLRSPLLL